MTYNPLIVDSSFQIEEETAVIKGKDRLYFGNKRGETGWLTNERIDFPFSSADREDRKRPNGMPFARQRLFN